MLDERVLMDDKASLDADRLPGWKISRPRAGWLSRWGIIAALQVAEAVLVATNSSFWLAVIIASGGNDPKTVELIMFGSAVAALVHFGLRTCGAYDFSDLMHLWRSCKMAATAWMRSTGTLLFIALLFTPTVTFSRMVILGWLAGLSGIVCVRLAAALATNAIVRAGWLIHNVVIIGTGPAAQCCAKLLRANGHGTNVVGFVSVDGIAPDNRPEHVDAVQLSDLQRLINAHEVKDVIISTSFYEQVQSLPDLVKSLLWLPVRVLLWPPSIGVEPGLLAGGGYRIGNIPLLLAGVPPLDGWHWVIKDVRDRVLAFLLLIFTAPLLLVIMLMIRLTSPGPILFKQQREGYGGAMFTIFKFRTMRASESPSSRLTLTTRDDPRVFPVGALLRKTSLDELPQLINVILGDMWLVGPRPHSPLAMVAGQPYSAAVSGYMARLRVKPGITGWAQVNGWRGPTNTIEQIQQRFTFDLHYIQHLSLWFDLQILLLTATKGFIHKNAY